MRINPLRASAGIRSKAILLLFLPLAVFLFAAVANASAQSPRLPDPGVLEDFASLISHIEDISPKMLTVAQRSALLEPLQKAESTYNNRRVCGSQKHLAAFLKEAQSLRRGVRTSMAETIYGRGRSLAKAIFDVYYDNPDLKPAPCFDPSDRLSPNLSVRASDNKHFAASVTFGAAEFTAIDAGGETWTQLSLPGIDSLTGPPGMPALPFWRGLLAVPKGADVKLKMEQTPNTIETLRANLFPFQSQAADLPSRASDSKFENPPFIKDEKLYAGNAFYPEKACSVRILGTYRDLEIVQVACAAGQYNPASDVLRLFKSVDFNVDFEGGKGHFITTQTKSPFEAASAHALSSVINRAVLPQYIEKIDVSNRICTGEELLILTHPDFRPAAADLADWKETRGIVTTVREVGPGTTYDTADKIDDFIEHRYDSCQVRPSYILLLGDVEFVPPARTDYDTTGEYCSQCGDVTTGSDYGYAIYPHFLFDVLLPYFGVSRISVDTLEEAQLVVNKIITYESMPPYIDSASGSPFYTTAALAANFECCRMNQDGSPRNGQDGRAQRSFVETAELARSTLLDAGKSVERIYTTTVDTGGYCLEPVGPGGCPADKIQQPYAGDPTPNRYRDGSLLPLDLRDGSGFPWDGDTLDVADNFNDGRFLILHRDHGSSSGFYHPNFWISDLWRLSNEYKLPVVYSVNCSSGRFDRETDSGSTVESFMEALLLESDGGMVGGLGDVRNSPTWANSALARGFFDATWPDLAPEYGDDISIRRLADILNHGKVYILTQIGVPQTAGSVSFEAVVAENIMWHAYGDPTLEMWTRNPYRLVLSAEHSLERYADHLQVKYKVEGALITAMQDSRNGLVPIGRGTVRNGVAKLSYFNTPNPKFPIILSASKENAVSVSLTQTGKSDGAGIR